MTKKKNIAFVECSSGFGGSAKCVYQFVTAMNASEFQPFVFCSKIVGWFESLQRLNSCLTTPTGYIPENSVAKPALINRYIFKAASLCRLVLRSIYFYREFKKYDIQLAHSNNNIYEHIPVVIACKLLHIPVVCHLHDQTPPTALEKLFIPLVDKFFVLSASAQDIFSRNIPISKLHVIRNGLLVSEYDSCPGTEATISHPAIGVVGRLIPWKGQETLIKSAPLILRDFPSARFYVIGDDPGGDKTYGDYLKKLVVDLHIEESVFFTGWINDPRNIIKELDICVCTSTDPEPFGLVLLESMLLGTLVISTRHGGPLDIIQEGMDGFFYRPGDHEELSKLIISILNDSSLADKLVETARNKVMKYYDVAHIMGEIQAVYTDLISGSVQ